MLKEDRHDPRNRSYPSAQTAPIGAYGGHPARAYRLARREQLDYASFLEIILSDEVNRRADRHIELRLQGAGFEETCRLEDFDWSAAVTLDRRMLDAVFSLEFLAKHEHVLLVGPAGVGKSFLAQSLGYTPYARDTPSASSTLTISSGPWPRPGWTTQRTAPSGPS